MRLYHHTAACNLARIFSEGHLWACATTGDGVENGWMSGGTPVVWLTAKPDDVICTPADREEFQRRGWDDLAADNDRYYYSGCLTHPGIVRLTLKVANRRKRVVVPYYEWVDSVLLTMEFEDGSERHITSKHLREIAPSPRAEHWWICLQDISVRWIESIEPVGEPSPEYLRIVEWLQTDQCAPPPVFHEEDAPEAA